MVGIRGLGFLLGLRTRRPARDVLGELRERGILAGGCDDSHIVRLLPPLIIDDSHVDRLVAVLKEIPAMKRFLDLLDLPDDRLEAVLARARQFERRPRGTALRDRTVGLVFMNPSLRTLASMEAGVAQLGGDSVVIQPGAGSWKLETRTGVVMDGDAVEHVREAIPVLAQYVDALGVRCFAEGKSLAEDLSDRVIRLMAELCPVPFINLESAASHPCQALADWKTLDDLDVPRSGGHFVLSWAWHPKPLPYAVPASVLGMAARRGMQVTVLHPPGFALPGGIMEQARVQVQRSGGTIGETSDRREAMAGAHVLYAKSWAAPEFYGRPQDEAALRARVPGLVRDRGVVPARAAERALHALPAGPPQREGRRRRTRRPAQRRRAAGREPPPRPEGAARRDARQRRGDGAMTRGFSRGAAMIGLKRAIPYLRLYRGRIFVIKAGGAVCGDAAALRSLAEQIQVLHELGIRVVRSRTAAGPRSPRSPSGSGLKTTFVQGRRVTCENTLESAIMALNGSVNTAFLSACRAARVSAVGLSGLDGGLVRAMRRPPQVLPGDGLPVEVDYGHVGDIVSVDVAVLHRILEAGMVPVVSSLSADDQGQVLNVNADTFAARLAVEIGAEKLIFLTDTPGLLEDRNNPDHPGELRGHRPGQGDAELRRDRRGDASQDPGRDRGAGGGRRARAPRRVPGPGAPSPRGLYQRGRGNR